MRSFIKTLRIRYIRRTINERFIYFYAFLSFGDDKMAAGDSAVIIELLGDKGDPVRYTVADGTGIEKGQLLKISDPRTAAATSADNDPFAGIAASEKVANDGQTSLACYTHGIFDINAAAGITAGERVSVAGDDEVTKVAAADLLFSDVGIALETAGAADEVIAVLVGSGF